MNIHTIISQMKKGWLQILVILRPIFAISLCLPLLALSPAQALTNSEIKSLVDGTWAYNPDMTTCTSSASPAASSSATTNTDYAGRPILSAAQLQAISQNTSVYQQAANQVDIPWQMIAVIHLRETGGKVYNPSNGQGVYQMASGQGGPYPSGPVDAPEFLRQTVFAAQYIKGKANSNYAANKSLTTTSPASVIKDTFFSYNGRATVYTQQAQNLSVGLGLVGNVSDQGYEGSPYVMNKADSLRDPGVNKTTWGQIKTDHGGLSYPANSDYGAFVMYAALAGISLDGACGSSTLSGTAQNKVVTLAKQELEAWNTGVLKANGSDYHKYTDGRSENWCADFVSWLYNQAGYPLSTTAKNGSVPQVVSLQAIGQQNTRFSWHQAGSYTPQPGDIVILPGHTNLVVAVNGKTITIIGGNQGYASGGATSFSNSKVTQYDIVGFSSGGIIGYVSPNGGQ